MTDKLSYDIASFDDKTKNILNRQVKLLRFAIKLLLTSHKYIKSTELRLRTCERGCNLLIHFLWSTALAILAFIPGILGWYPFVDGISELPWLWWPIIIAVVIIEHYLFWNGIVFVYLSSKQIGIKWRGLGALCGMIPILNLIMLLNIIWIAKHEVIFERKKIERNKLRKAQKICQTKYPILLVHGIFFRDSNLMNYWGRIPSELIENGATIFYSDHDSSSSVVQSARMLERKILEIRQKTGCEKVNIIAHSKGGLDSRSAIITTSAENYIASLTTINTPHRGCKFVEYLLGEISENEKQGLANAYNSAAAALGDEHPDFLTAVSDLTASRCAKFNEIIKDSPKVYYQSFGSYMKAKTSAGFPLSFSYPIVNSFDKINDGLVGVESMKWGEQFTLIEPKGKRGVSHADIIDLTGENIPDFDVLEMYVQLVADLKNKGF